MADLELPQNLNILGNNNFHFEIRELPTVSLFAQTFTIPGVSLGREQIPTSAVNYNMPSEKMEFEDLVFTFMIDEHLKNWLEIFNWIVSLGFPENTSQFRDMKEGRKSYSEVSDIIMTTTTNKFNAANEFHFVDCFPTDLSPVDFTNTDTTISPIQATVTFDYSYFTVKPLN
jgi:hypothetical protein